MWTQRLSNPEVWDGTMKWKKEAKHQLHSTKALTLSQIGSESADTFSVVWWVHVSIAFGKNCLWVLCAKDKKNHPGCYQQKKQSQHLWWYAGASVFMVWMTCIFLARQSTPLIRMIWLFWFDSSSDMSPCNASNLVRCVEYISETCRDRCYCEGDSFSKEVDCYFSKVMTDLILHDLQHFGLIDTVCAWLACLQYRSVSPLKMHAASPRREPSNDNHRMLRWMDPFFLQNSNNEYPSFPMY